MRYADTLLADGEIVVLRRRQHWLALFLEARAALALWVAAVGLLAAGWFFDFQGTAAQFVGIAALVCLILGVIIFAIRYWQWWAQDFMITNRRLLKVTGVINKRASSSALEKINDAILDHNLVGRIMNFGDIDIVTASGEVAVDYFRMINAAKDFKRTLTSQKHALEMEYRFNQAPSPPLRAPMDMNGEPAAAAFVTPSPPAERELPVETEFVSESTPEPEPEPEPPMNTAQPVSVAPAAGPPEATEDRSLEITKTLVRLADLRDRGAISADEYEAKKAELLRRL